MRFTLTIATILFFIATSSGRAALSTSNTFSSKWSVLGGVGEVNDADALYLNPARLGEGAKSEMAAHFAAKFINSSGPLITNNNYEGESVTTTDLALLWKMKLGNRWGIGLGHYPVAIWESSYPQVDMSVVETSIYPWKAYQPSLHSYFDIDELALGASYRYSGNILLGVAFRATIAEADYSYLEYDQPTDPNNMVAVSLKEMSGSHWGGFSLGASYRPDSMRWGAEMLIRTPIQLTLQGLSSAVEQSALVETNAQWEYGPQNATMKMELPLSISLGGQYYLAGGREIIFGTYNFINYAQASKFSLEGESLLVFGSTREVIKGQEVLLHWNDFHQIKLGYQIEKEGYELMGGYAITWPVATDDGGNSQMAAPGFEHALSGGASFPWSSGAGSLELSTEYSWIEGQNKKTPSAAENFQRTMLEGDFSTEVIAFYLGARWRW